MTLRPSLLARDWLITTEHYLSAQAGAAVLQAGGSAMDAAVAAILAEGVVNPHMLTLGGEVVMLVEEGRTGSVHVVNGNTRAPRALTADRCRKAGLSAIPPDHPFSWGVPSQLDGLLAALDRWGTATFESVSAGARDLARRGFPMHPGLRGPGEFLSIHADQEKFRARWPSTARLYLPEGRLPDVGQPFRNPELADTLDFLARTERRAGGGRSDGLAAVRTAFYRGEPAAAIGRFCRERGGVLDQADLAAHDTPIESPISRGFAGLTVFKCPPWSQGGVLLQALALLDPDELRRAGHNSADYLHLLVEALKLAFADRERYYGDPGRRDVPVEALLSDEYAARRRELIDPARASVEERPGDPRKLRALLEGPHPRPGPPGHGTVHVNVVDRDRNAVSATASGAWIGGAPVVPGLGFPLTTRLQTFSLDPDHPNVVEPGKQPRTTLSPTLALDEGDGGERGDRDRARRRRMLLGTMGGDHQDQWNLQVLLNLALFDMSVQDAIEAPRVSTHHAPNSFYPHEAKPGHLRVEARVPYDVRRELQARGHQLELRPDWSEGYVVAIVTEGRQGIMAGGADPRGEAATVIPAYAIGW